MSENALDQFESQVELLLAGLKPAARKKKLQKVGVALRKANQKRIGQQVNSDGSAYAPRKKKPGTVKRAKKMLMGLRKAKRMKVKSSSDGVEVGFDGIAAIIAMVHQQGDMGKVAKGLFYQYPTRELLGFNDDDKQTILDILLDDEL